MSKIDSVKSYKNNYTFEKSDDIDMDQVKKYTEFWDSQPTPFNRCSSCSLSLFPGNLFLSFPMKNAAGVIIGSSFVPNNRSSEKEWDVDLGYITFRCALLLQSLNNCSVCITTDFDQAKAKIECTEFHSLEYKCPIAIVVGKKATNPNIVEKAYSWFKDQPDRLPLDKICEGHKDLKNAKLKEALDVMRHSFSLGNAQNWRVLVDDWTVRFFTGSSLDVRYFNIGFAMAAFATAANEYHIKGKWICEKGIQHRDWEYVLTWSMRPTDMNELN